MTNPFPERDVDYEKDMLTVKELVYITGKSERTIRRYIALGMPYGIKGITMARADDWLINHRRKRRIKGA